MNWLESSPRKASNTTPAKIKEKDAHKNTGRGGRIDVLTSGNRPVDMVLEPMRPNHRKINLNFASGVGRGLNRSQNTGGGAN